MAIDFQDSTPLYVQVIKDLKNKINTGQLDIGEQLKSHKELAIEYDVSLITIKSALSQLIDEGMLYSRVGKGTFVADKKPTPAITDHKSIGLVLRDLKNPFFSLITHTIEEKAYAENYTILISNSSSQIRKEEGQIRNFKKMGAKGLIIASSRKDPEAPQIIRTLDNENFPYVMVSYVADEDIYYVGTDHEYGAYIATEHLLNQGHTKIGYINSPISNILGDVRNRGYVKAMKTYGLDPNPDFHFRLTSDTHPGRYEAGYQLGDKFDALKEKPTAFFTYNDISALGFINRLLQIGYKVPEDVAIVGFDDIEQSAYANVPLTTVHQPVEQIGAAAINKLIAIINNENPPYRTILKPELVIRKSCGAKLKTKV